MDILGQIGVCVPSIMAATSLITSAIGSAFNIESGKVRHILTWVIAVIAGVLFKLVGTFSFGLGGWDYLVAAIFGVISGASSNGFYDWEKIKVIIDTFGNIFKKKDSSEEEKKDN